MADIRAIAQTGLAPVLGRGSDLYPAIRVVHTYGCASDRGHSTGREPKAWGAILVVPSHGQAALEAVSQSVAAMTWGFVASFR